MSLYGPITLYAHEDYDDDNEFDVGQGIRAGLTKAQASKFAKTKPLYEVAFEFYVDPDKGTAYCTKVDLGDGEPFTRTAPGQQLGLFPS